MQKIYKIHRNGSRPFKVVIDDNENGITVYVHKEHGHREYKVLPKYIFNVKKVFIGCSVKNEMTTFSGGYGPKFDGNTILAHLHDNTYVHIGDEVFTFTSISPLVRYESPIGNNDVPYPYAVDENNNIYLLIGEVILLSAPDRIITPEFDPYTYYYERYLITTDRGFIPPTHPIIKNFKGIKKFYHGDDQYTLKYVPKPHKNYDDCVSRLGPAFITNTQKQKKMISKMEYVQIMTEFGQLNGFRPIENITKAVSQP